MTTQQLTELQRSITQGEWKVQEHGSIMCRHLSIAETYKQDKDESNAKAIALVPELIAEVIRLRVLVELHANQCAEWSSRMALSGNAEEAKAYKQDELIARAALANDK